MAQRQTVGGLIGIANWLSEWRVLKMEHWQADAKERPSVTVLAMVPIVADWQIWPTPPEETS